MNNFIKFCKDNFGESIDTVRAEEILIGYLKSYDLDFLFAAHYKSALPKVDMNRAGRFLFSKFIEEILKNDQTLFSILADISIGHILAGTLLFDEFSNFAGKLNNQSYYLDSNIIFELIGTHGPDRQHAYVQFFNILNDAGIKLYLFEHIYDELITNLQHCVNWIENDDYDPKKASRALIFFRVNNYTTIDINQFIARIPGSLDKFKITVVNRPEYMREKEFQIDEVALKKMIVDQYQQNDPFFNADYKDTILQNDVDAISGIHRLRRGSKPKYFKDASHIFITKNSSLASVCSQFESKHYSGMSINSCLTDTFVGTLIWMQSPIMTDDINIKKLIFDSFAAFEPDSNLVRNYLESILKLKKDGEITEEEYYLLRSDEQSFTLLERKTLGDPSRFTDKHPHEILEEIKANIRKDGEVKYSEEVLDHESTKEFLSTYSGMVDKYRSRNEYLAKRVASWVDHISVYSLWILTILAVSSTIGGWPIGAAMGWPWVLNTVIVSTITATSVIFGFDFKQIRSTARSRIETKSLRKLDAFYQNGT